MPYKIRKETIQVDGPSVKRVEALTTGGVFAVSSHSGDCLELYSGDDESFRTIGVYNKYWIPSIIATLKRALADNL